MEKTTKNAEDVMADRLGAHQVVPPPAVWAGIEAKMAQADRKVGPFWLLDLALMVVVFSAFIAQAFVQADVLAGNEHQAPTQLNVAAGDHENAKKTISLSGQAMLQEENAEAPLSGTSNEELKAARSQERMEASSFGPTNQGSADALHTREEDQGAASLKGTTNDLTTQGTAVTAKSANNALVSEAPKQPSERTSTPAALGSMLPLAASVEQEGAIPQAFYPIAFCKPTLPVASSTLDSLASIPMERVKDIRPLKTHQFFLGLQGALNLASIFNQNTRGAYGARELPYRPTLGYAGAVRLGYTYKHRYGVETGFIFHSKQGQHYEGNIGAALAARQVDLSYMQIPLVLRYTFGNKFTKKTPAPWVIGLGAQFGFLTAASETFEGNEAPFDAAFTPVADYTQFIAPMEVAAVMSLDKEIYLNRFMFVGVGLRASFSSDINAEGHAVNDGYGKSHNFIFGFTVSFNGFLEK